MKHWKKIKWLDVKWWNHKIVIEIVNSIEIFITKHVDNDFYEWFYFNMIKRNFLDVLGVECLW
jgi:hypothetical protein